METVLGVITMQIRQEKNILKTSVNTALVSVDNDYIKEGHFDCPKSIQVWPKNIFATEPSFQLEKPFDCSESPLS